MNRLFRYGIHSVCLACSSILFKLFADGLLPPGISKKISYCIRPGLSLWMANYYLSQTNSHLGSLAPDGGLPYPVAA
jgi:hypothetical protein